MAGGRLVQQDDLGAARPMVIADLQRALLGIGQQPGQKIAPVGQFQPLQQLIGGFVQRLLPAKQVSRTSSDSLATTNRPQRMFSNTVMRGKIEVIWKLREKGRAG